MAWKNAVSIKPYEVAFYYYISIPSSDPEAFYKWTYASNFSGFVQFCADMQDWNSGLYSEPGPVVDDIVVAASDAAVLRFKAAGCPAPGDQTVANLGGPAKMYCISKDNTQCIDYDECGALGPASVLVTAGTTITQMR